jgi:uncharacterized membrane protein YeaQ/YmgE (transglycosylase-associated protein family)
MKRVTWTIGMAAAGLFLGLKGQDTPADIVWTVVSMLWAAAIGVGIGTIFDKEHPSRHLPVYWAITLALVFALIGMVTNAVIRPSTTDFQEALAGLVGAMAGALLGLRFGSMHQKKRHSISLV